MIESNQVYIAIDLHSKHSKMGYMNEQGEYLGQQGMQTTAQNLIGGVAKEHRENTAGISNNYTKSYPFRSCSIPGVRISMIPSPIYPSVIY